MLKITITIVVVILTFVYLTNYYNERDINSLIKIEEIVTTSPKIPNTFTEGTHMKLSEWLKCYYNYTGVTYKNGDPDSLIKIAEDKKEKYVTMLNDKLQIFTFDESKMFHNVKTRDEAIFDKISYTFIAMLTLSLIILMIGSIDDQNGFTLMFKNVLIIMMLVFAFSGVYGVVTTLL